MVRSCPFGEQALVSLLALDPPKCRLQLGQRGPGVVLGADMSSGSHPDKPQPILSAERTGSHQSAPLRRYSVMPGLA